MIYPHSVLVKNPVTMGGENLADHCCLGTPLSLVGILGEFLTPRSVHGADGQAVEAVGASLPSDL